MTPRAHPPIIGRFRSIADLEDIESVPWRERIPATDTYALLRDACRRRHDRTALRLLLAGEADAPVRSISYGDLLDGVHRTANVLHALGVRPKVPVAILLPNLIEGHFALWGAQAAGIATPINPLLEDAYIARICAETGVQVMVALGRARVADLVQGGSGSRASPVHPHAAASRHGRGTRRPSMRARAADRRRAARARGSSRARLPWRARAGLGRIAHVRARI